MATFTLQPLSDETIDAMGINNHDLWLVRINKTVLGPFETESLRSYALENEELFNDAQANRMDEHQFKPFWNHPQFQRRKPSIISSTQHQSRFWLLLTGQKTGPHSFQEIDEKIEHGELVLTDQISTDDGHTWKKIFNIPDFDRRRHSAETLPVSPTELSFQEAKLKLVEKFDHPKVAPQEELAEMFFHGKQAKVLTLKLDELTLNKQQETTVSQNMKWAIPGAAAAIVLFLTAGYFSFAPEMKPLEQTVVQNTKKNSNKKAAPSMVKAAPKGVIPVIERAPASINDYRPRPREEGLNQASRYPTIIETHRDERSFEEPIREDVYAPDELPAEPEIHSLVNPTHPDTSLDSVMSGTGDQPVIEEVTDF